MCPLLTVQNSSSSPTKTGLYMHQSAMWLPSQAGIVVEHHVPRAGVVGEERRDGLCRENQRPEVDRQVLALHDHLWRPVEDRVREVTRDGEDARAAGPFHRQRHLALGGLERSPHDGEGDRVDVRFAVATGSSWWAEAVSFTRIPSSG